MSVWKLHATSLGFSVALLMAGCGTRTELPVLDDREAVDPEPGAPGMKPPEGPKPDVFTADCTDENKNSIYALSGSKELLRLDPTTWSSSLLGVVECDEGAGGLFSMTVSRNGKAYLPAAQNRLFEVDLATAACKPTSLVVNQPAFTLGGMSMVTKDQGPDEELFVNGFDTDVGSTGMLGKVDPSSFAFTFIGPYSKQISINTELTGRGDGRLFGLFIEGGIGSDMVFHLAEVDKQTAAIKSDVIIPLTLSIFSFAMAFWGGDFYMFLATQTGPTRIFKVSPSDGAVVEVASIEQRIVGVGATTCAPL